MKVIVIGPGAMGCLLAAKLSRDHEVWLLDHDADRAGRLASAGLLLEEEGRVESCPIRATADASRIGAADLALFCVKSHQIKEALLAAEAALRHTRLLVTLANGLGHLDILAEYCRGRCWGVGVTAQGATMAGTGRVLRRGAGATIIGPLPTNGGAVPGTDCELVLTEAAAALTAAGVPTQVVADILPSLWEKLLVNVGINALTAINNCPNGMLLASPGLVELMTAAVTEGALVASRLGITLPADPMAGVLKVCRATAANISSMLQDVRAGRRTEIEAINGAVVKRARALGVEVPVNTELLGRVRELERKLEPSEIAILSSIDLAP